MSDDIEMEWKKFKEETHQCVAAALGYSKQKHQDWFNENDTNIVFNRCWTVCIVLI